MTKYTAHQTENKNYFLENIEDASQTILINREVDVPPRDGTVGDA